MVGKLNRSRKLRKQHTGEKEIKFRIVPLNTSQLEGTFSEKYTRSPETLTPFDSEMHF